MQIEGRLGITTLGEEKCTKVLYNPLLEEPYQGYFREQIGILSSLVHPALRKSEIRDYNPQTGFSFITDRAKLTLEDLIAGKDPSLFTNHNKMFILITVAHAMAYLHRNCVLHGNLHPRNVVFDNNLRVKLMDYGLNSFAKKTPAQVDAENGRATPFLAPELINQTVFDASSDVFAFGTLMYQVLYRESNWMYDNPYKLALIIGGSFSVTFPQKTIFKDCESLIRACWNPKLSLRPTFDTIVNTLHKSMQEVSNVNVNAIMKELHFFNSNIRDLVPPTAPKFFAQMTFAAIGGWPIGMKDYANVWLKGKHFAPNIPKGLYYLKKAARAGNGKACEMLGLFYEQGRHVEQDLMEAYDLFEIASQYPDCTFSAYKFAYFLINGIGGLKDQNRGFTVCKQGADNKNYNNLDCINYLGELYEYGYGTAKDIKKAKEYYKLAAKSNFPKALYNIARTMEEDPKSRKKDIKPAYEKAANAGSPEAMNRLGEMNMEDKKNGSPDKAVGYFTEAASKGCLKANYNMALYLYSIGNDKVATDYMENAARGGLAEAVQYLKNTSH